MSTTLQDLVKQRADLDALRRSLIHKPGGYAPTVSSNGAPKALYEGV